MDGMNYALFLTYSGRHEAGAPFRRAFEERALPALAAADGVSALDVFAPEDGVSDPYLNDGAGPVLIVQVSFASIADAERAMATPGLLPLLADPAGDGAAAVGAVHDFFSVHYYPVGDDAAPVPRTAALSFIVRYYRPVEDEAHFNRYYADHHPPIQANFPGIRNTLCYFPADWSVDMGIPPSDSFLGNEVVFDDLNALNVALNSDVRHQLREDYHTFPPFGGNVTHFAMHRRSVPVGKA